MWYFWQKGSTTSEAGGGNLTFHQRGDGPCQSSSRLKEQNKNKLRERVSIRVSTEIENVWKLTFQRPKLLFGILISENQTATQWQTEIACRPEQIQQQITIGPAVMRSMGFVQFKIFFWKKDTFDLLAWERQFLLISPIGEKRDWMWKQRNKGKIWDWDWENQGSCKMDLLKATSHRCCMGEDQKDLFTFTNFSSENNNVLIFHLKENFWKGV